MEYPFFDRIKSKLEAMDQTLTWLGERIGKSPKTFYNNKLISENSLETIEQISAALDFDFLKDYSDWRVENGHSPISTMREPEQGYKKEKEITVELKVTGGIKNIGLHFANVLEILQKEGDKYGFKIE